MIGVEAWGFAAWRVPDFEFCDCELWNIPGTSDVLVLHRHRFKIAAASQYEPAFTQTYN